MADSREVSSLPLARSVVDCLLKAGFRYVADLRGVQPLDLADEIGVTTEMALSIVRSVKDCFVEPSHDADGGIVTETVRNEATEELTAKDMVLKRRQDKPIISLCQAIDIMLGGGVQIGQISEFCGVPGIGKTQLGIQLSLCVQIPEAFGGNEGKAVYIDTEGSFMAERVAEMAAELANQIQKISRTRSNKDEVAHAKQQEAVHRVNTNTLLEGIELYRCHEQTELIATINHLSAHLKSNPSVKLVVVDSIAFLFRQDLDDMPGRNRILATLAQRLNQLAYDHSVAVVTINHVTTKYERVVGGGMVGSITEDSAGGMLLRRSSTGFGAGSGGGGSGVGVGGMRLVPALGDQWSHCVTNRVMMHWADSDFETDINNSSSSSSGGSFEPALDNRVRRASLVKSPGLPNAFADFQVCEKGVRDLKSFVARIRKRKAEQMQQMQRLQQMQRGNKS